MPEDFFNWTRILLCLPPDNLQGETTVFSFSIYNNSEELFLSKLYVQCVNGDDLLGKMNMLLYLRGPDAADRLAGIAKYNFFFLQSIIYDFTNFSPSMVTYLRGPKAVDRKGGIGGYNHYTSNPFADTPKNHNLKQHCQSGSTRQ